MILLHCSELPIHRKVHRALARQTAIRSRFILVVSGLVCALRQRAFGYPS